ncbi:MAG: zinc-ribbon domain-containing protein [Desulfovibrionaceae bacterium]|nr:zinc-ribbon domain-containing protein [Desulfovibrionaceae bacterium]MBF0513932.1 zinc-ribbon domain-containing protein [Desulfovibrionaceae bacterium]
MKVTCPNCQTKYNLPGEKIPGTGASARCSRCRHVFHVDKPEPAPETPAETLAETPLEAPAETPEAGPETGDQDLDDLFGDAGQEASEPAGSPDSPQAQGGPQTQTEDLDDLFGAPDADADKPAASGENDGIEDLFGDAAAAEGAARENTSIAFETEKKGLGKGGLGLGELAKSFASGKGKPKIVLPAQTKLIALIAAAVIALAGIGAGTLYLLKIGPFARTQPAQTAAPAPPPAEEKKPEDASKNLALTGVRQYMVDNAKAGNIFVIEGKVKNNFTTAKEYIKIEASLFDEKGVSLATKQIVAGNTVSYFQLQSLGVEELEAALNSQVGILTNNVNVRPGGDVPFMVVFYNPPESLQEFGVKVIDSKDPVPETAPDAGTGESKQ